jgi:hypothetical protein
MKQLIVIATATVLFLLTGINTFAQADTLTAEQAKTLINKEVIVKANVAGTRLFDKDGNKTFLINLDKRYPQSPLTVVLYDKAYKDLNLQYELEDKDIVAKGTVLLYNDRPQIIINDVKNLKILK